MAVANPPRRAVFVDKDGTLVENLPFNVDPDRITLCEGAGRALSTLARRGFRIVVISNQSGVARGFFPESALQAVEERISVLLAEEHASIDAFYYCPHHPKGVVPGYKKECSCRKPNPGLLVRAAAEMELDLKGSWMVGDILHDVEAGHRAGCRTVLIGNGNETEWWLSPERVPDFIVDDLVEAAETITSSSETPRSEPTGERSKGRTGECNPRCSAL